MQQAVTLVSVLVDVTRRTERQAEPGVVAVELRTFVISHLSTENSRRRRVRLYTLQQSESEHAKWTTSSTTYNNETTDSVVVKSKVVNNWTLVTGHM